MLVDTHVHLLASKTSRPDWGEIAYTLYVAKEKNIDVLCLTEHRDAVGFEELYLEVFSENRFGGSVEPNGTIKLASGVVISPGAEVSLVGGGDIGVHTDLEAVMSLDQRKNIYTPAEVLKLLDDRGSPYVSVAHHLLLHGKWWGDFEQVIGRIDAIEVPGKQSASMSDYLKLASKYSKGQLCGSDAHTWVQLGAGLTLIEKSKIKFDGGAFFDVAELKKHIVKDETVSCISDAANELVRISKLYKKKFTWMNSGECV